MRFLRITTVRDTYVPGPEYSKETGSRLADFKAPAFQLEKIGDAVHVTANGETNVIPWASVVGAMLDPAWVEETVRAAVPVSAFPGPARISAGPGPVKGKR